MDVESYNLGRRETLRLVGEGLGLGFLMFAGTSDNMRVRIPKAFVKSEIEYLGEDIKIMPSDYRVRPDEESLVQRIVTVIPNSRNHIRQIVGSVHAYSAIFPVPIEIAASHFQAESAFDFKARSPVFALGIAQFMRDTASSAPFNMTVYDEDSNPELYDLESSIMDSQKNLAKLEREYKKIEEREDPALLKKLHELHKAQRAHRELNRDYDVLFARTITPKKDQRIHPGLAVMNGVWYFALLGSRSKHKYPGGNNIYHIFRALSAYNAGPESSDKNPVGIAVNKETLNHIEEVARQADQIISPHGWLSAGRDTVMYARAERRREEKGFG